MFPRRTLDRRKRPEPYPSGDRHPVNPTFTEKLDERTQAAKTIQQQVRDLIDKDVLKAIERAYGGVIPKHRLERVKRSPAVILSHERYREYLTKALNLTPSEAARFLGHYDPEKNKVWASQLYPLTRRILAHERLHQLAHPGCSTLLGATLQEGVTELLARAAVGDPSFAGQPDIYPRETRLGEMLQARIGEDCLKRIYFHGPDASVRLHIDGTLGRRRLAELVRLADAGRFSEAEQLLGGGGLP